MDETATSAPIETVAVPVLPEVTEVVVRLQKPTEQDTCFGCRHRFGMHFITFDNKHSGCGQTVSGPRGGNPTPCDCSGYVLMPPQPFRR